MKHHRWYLVLSFLGLLTVLCPRYAQAEVWIEDYVLRLQMQPGSNLGHFTLSFGYVAAGEVKSEGFKFVGTEPIYNLQARDELGREVAVHIEGDVSGQTKIVYAVPPVLTPGTQIQRVAVSFDQSLDLAPGWSGSVVQIPWATTFRIPVRNMRIETEIENTQTVVSHCEGAHCESASGVNLTRQDHSTPASMWSVFFALFVGSVILFYWICRRRYDQLLQTKGYIPPPSNNWISEQKLDNNVYRAPPAIPPPQETKPRLPTTIVGILMCVCCGLCCPTL